MKQMKIAKRACLLFMATALMTACAGAGLVGEVDEEGLQQLRLERVDYFAAHPGADLATFTDVYIEPVALEFRRGWRPQTTGSHIAISRTELAELQSQLEESFMQAFEAGLLTNDRLRVVDAEAPGVLRITPRLVKVSMTNLSNHSNPGQTSSRASGEATLQLAISDARTGIVVVRMEDRRFITQPGGGFTVMGAATAHTAFAQVFESWGRFAGKGILNISPE